MQSNFSRLALAGCVALVMSTASPAQDGTLVTLFEGGNGQDGNMFNIKTTCDLVVTGFDVHFRDENNPAPCGTTCSVTEVEVYSAVGGWNPIATNAAAWTLEGAVQHTSSTPLGTPQPLALPVSLAFDAVTSKRAIYITNTGANNTVTGLPNEILYYTDAAFPGQKWTNGDIEVIAGAGSVYPFAGTFTPRAWNGVVHFTQTGGCTGCTANPVNYCTAGISATGCQATMEAVGEPSPTKGEGFIVYTTGFEGDKDGIFFYGQNGRQASPWGNGTSFQCVTPPVKRSGTQGKTGSSGSCDGWAQKDLNALWCTSGCQKNPPIPGVKMQIQFWYRDPQNTSNQTTSLSDAIEVDVCP